MSNVVDLQRYLPSSGRRAHNQRVLFASKVPARTNTTRHPPNVIYASFIFSSIIVKKIKNVCKDNDLVLKIAWDPMNYMNAKMYITWPSGDTEFFDDCYDVFAYLSSKITNGELNDA